jgi:YfiH family protein
MPPPSTDGLLFHIQGLTGQPGLRHGFSTRALGSMRGPGRDGSALTPQRAAFARAAGLEPRLLTVVGAVHGAEVARVDRPLGSAWGFDALMTDRPGLPLMATFGDCCPVLLYDPGRRALALAHAGWRGTAAGVARRAVDALRREYGVRPADLVAGLGPGICGGCYEVGEEVAARFDPSFVTPAASGRHMLDVTAANRAQLEAEGVPGAAIHEHGACTKESTELPSHRRRPDGDRFACIAAIVVKSPSPLAGEAR